MKIYADILLAINFSMDLISLFITSAVMRRRPHKKRMLVSAGIGGIYGVFAVVLPMNAVLSAIIGVLVSFLMCMIAFYEKSIKRLTALYIIYWGTSACLGGFMSILYSFLNKILAEYIKNYSYTQAYTGARFFIVVAIAVLISIILGKFFTSEKEIKEVRLSATINEKCFEIKGLCDSGNLLTEPISGKCVILVTEKSQLGKEICKIDDIYKRYIPFSSVGGKGMIKGVVPSSIKIEGIERTAIVAPVSTNDFAGYEACIPMSLV